MYENARSALRSMLERLAPSEPERARFGESTPEQHRLYGRLLRSFPGMAYRCRNDPSWRMEYASHGCRPLLGFDPHDLVESRVVSFATLIHPDDRQRVWDTMQHAIVADQAFELTYRIRRVDGNVRWVWDRGRPVLGPRGDIEALEGFITDVTEHQAFMAGSSQRDHEAQKMEALGQLAAGVAHDFNNALAVIRGTAQLLIVERSDDTMLATELADIIEATDRGVSLSRQLIRFGRSRQHEGIVASLSQVARDLVPTLQGLVGDGIELELSLDTTDATAWLDPTHVEEVMVNLVVNARDAMPGGGRLTIATHESVIGESAVDAPARRAVVLEVCDSGSGIPLAARSRIFEPYFTTKGKSGRGLGLSNVWRVVHDAGGRVELESEVGKGSTFRVLLPAAGSGGSDGGAGGESPRARS